MLDNKLWLFHQMSFLQFMPVKSYTPKWDLALSLYGEHCHDEKENSILKAACQECVAPHFPKCSIKILLD